MDTHNSQPIYEFTVLLWPRAPNQPWQAQLRPPEGEPIEFCEPAQLLGYLERLVLKQSGLR